MSRALALFPLLMLVALGCARDRVTGTWAVDPDQSHYFQFSTTQPSAANDRIEARHRQQLASLQYIFHTNADGNPWADKFDGLVEMRQGDQVVGFAAWKALPPPKGNAKGPDPGRAYEMYEFNGGNTFMFQGPFVVKGNRAEWRPLLGDLGGAVLVFKRK